MALIFIGGWFFGCFCLIAYRLKSDDLELMEREVYEELQKKKEVERYLAKSKREDELKQDPFKSSPRNSSIDIKTKEELGRPDRSGLWVIIYFDNNISPFELK